MTPDALQVKRDGAPAQRPLLPIFIATAFVSVLVITALTWLGLSRVLNAELERRSQDDARRAAHALANAIQSPAPAPDSSEWAAQDERVRTIMEAYSLIRVRVFGADRALLYTSDDSAVGRAEPMPDELGASLQGSTATLVAAAHTIWRTPPDVAYQRSLAATYVPVFLVSARAKASVEACADVSQDVSAAGTTLRRSVLVVFGALGVAFLVLTAVMSRAQRAIVSGAAALGEARARSRAEEALRAVVEATAGATGDDFFRRLVEKLAVAFGARWSFVVELPGGRPDDERPRAVALWPQPECARFAGALEALSESGPEGDRPGEPAAALRDVGAAWITSAPLRNAAGHTIGFMGALHDAPIDAAPHHASIMSILAARAGAELERLRAAEALERSRERLRVAERLASIGALAAGIGHDLNNLLLPMRGHIRSLLARESGATPLSADAHTHAAGLAQSVEFLRQLGENLRMLADGGADLERHTPGDPRATTRLHAWWAQVGPMLSRALPRHVRVDADLDPSLPPVAVAPARLTQAALNLLINAGDAIKPGVAGLVRIEAAPASDGFVRFTVSDNGRGMAGRVARLAFDPFFTTKAHASSTGLGLALVQQVATSAGGWAEVESEEGCGASVHLFLPAARVPAGDGVFLRVAISIEDNRMAAYAGALLAAEGCHVSRHAPAPDDPGDGSDVWMLDENSARPVLVRAYIAARPGRRVIVLGARPAGWDADPVEFVGETLDAETLRRALRTAAPPPEHQP